jgi:predicted  nucleic acid-binding Zn-ribbon protein
MTVEVALLISIVSVIFGIYQGVTNTKRGQKADYKNEASQLTTVIVKLENIGTGITEIKSEMSNIKNENKENRERIVKMEESTKSAHKRMDQCEKFCKRFTGNDSEETN